VPFCCPTSRACRSQPSVPPRPPSVLRRPPAARLPPNCSPSILIRFWFDCPSIHLASRSGLPPPRRDSRPGVWCSRGILPRRA
jgi:hypothetical protein